jgi:hypothetical protein
MSDQLLIELIDGEEDFLYKQTQAQTEKICEKNEFCCCNLMERMKDVMCGACE